MGSGDVLAPVAEARELVGTTLLCVCLYWVRAHWLSTVREVHRLLVGVAYQLSGDAESL